MNAVDTDIVVHFLVDDERSQAERACEIIESGDIFVCTTVLLEVEWVFAASTTRRG